MARKGPKNGQFWAKNAIFGHKWPQGPLVAAKSGTNGGSQWNTCGGTTLDEKLVRKVHLKAWKVPKNGQFWAILWGDYSSCKTRRNNAPNGMEVANFGQKTPFLAMSGPRDPQWVARVEQLVDHSGTHVGELL